MSLEADALRRLATYGTLGPGRPNNHVLAGLRGTWTKGTVRGALFAEGWGAAQGYPGIVLGAGDAVAVDLLESDDLTDHWQRLDAFEGEGYRRAVTMVETPDGPRAACIYVLAERERG